MEVKKVDPFYKSKAWYRIRHQALQEQGRRCKMCGTVRGKLSVHHIKPRSKHPELELVLSNLLVVCNSCHNQIHSRNDGELRELITTDSDGFSNDEWR